MVIDASFAVAFVTGDRPVADSTLEQVAASQLVAPSLWWFEVANTMVTLVRRKLFTDVEADRMLAELSDLRVADDAAGAERTWTATLALARLHKLTVYAAAYLELAVRLDQPLATYDKALIAAAGCEHVEVIQ